ncbi:MAG: hypothetical protein IJL26_08740 [Clostridia bacterium]|nr:hypothetical protein [Clostridia bacterium]
MKRAFKILTVVLAVLMASLLASPAIAADTETDKSALYAPLQKGIGYVAIGDSFTRGYGAGDVWQDHIYLNDTYGNFECRNVPGSYPNLVAEKFGLAAPEDIRDMSGKLWPLAHDAVSTAYVLDLLGIDDGFRDEEFTYAYSYMTERYETDLRYFGDPLSYALDGQSTYGQTGEIMSVRDMIKNASLITIGVGQTDVIYKAQIFGLNVLDFNDTASLPAGVAHIIELLDKYFHYWENAYPLLIDYVRKVNPDAKIVLVGTLNPLKDATLNDEIEIKIGSILNGIMDRVNQYTQRCALQYGCLYVDISDVDTPTSVNPKSIGQIMSITDSIEYALIAHPTPHGYEQIADRIIDVVEKDLQKDAARQVAKSFLYRFIEWFKSLMAKIAGLLDGISGKLS